MMILFWVLIIVGVVYLVKNTNIIDKNDNRQNKQARQDDSAIEIARERYAKGEIDKEEFEKILNDLEN